MTADEFDLLIELELREFQRASQPYERGTYTELAAHFRKQLAAAGLLRTPGTVEVEPGPPVGWGVFWVGTISRFSMTKDGALSGVNLSNPNYSVLPLYAQETSEP